MKLLIAIPALDEAEAIDDIVTRSLAARAVIVAQSPIDEVAITVVSDGSTDETVARARTYTPDVDLIVFPRNRGYGAAIKEAWERSDADVLGFLDADGTCDPAFFAVLCSTLVTEGADIVTGCRMNARSHMPRTRRIGNAAFAAMLTYMSATGVRDVASGMRVVRRSSLPRMLPLPDGLHFTPAMSARAVLGGDLRLVEIDMPYEERIGSSKLRVLRDGARFVRIISRTAFLYRPGRLLWSISALAVVGSALMVASPLVHYVDDGSLQDWMVYRCSAASLFGIAACLFFAGGHLATRVTDVAIFHRDSPGLKGRVRRLVGRRSFLLLPAALLVASLALGWSGFSDYVSTGHVDTHWSRVLAILTLVTIALIMVVLKVLDTAIGLVQQRVDYLTRSAQPIVIPGAVEANR